MLMIISWELKENIKLHVSNYTIYIKALKTEMVVFLSSIIIGNTLFIYLFLLGGVLQCSPSWS
jgi:hypothetical protein